MTRGMLAGRAMIDRETIHIHDSRLAAVETEFPEDRALTRTVGIRTVLATPLLREGRSDRGHS